MTTLIGSLAALLTAACWVPQLARTLRRGTADDFAWPYLTMMMSGVGLWCLYGIVRSDPPIYLCNGFVLASILVVVAVKVRSRQVAIEGLTVTVRGGGAASSALEPLLEVGARLAADLRSVGIPDLATLQAVGTAEACRRLEADGRLDPHPLRALGDTVTLPGALGWSDGT